MTVWFFIVWLLPAAPLVAMTYAEGQSVGGAKWDSWRIAGLLGCLAWPITLPVFVALARRHQRKARSRFHARFSNDNFVPVTAS